MCSMESSKEMPMLFPIEQNKFWEQIRQIVKEEVSSSQKGMSNTFSIETPGLIEKPLYKIGELCSLFNISRTTIYEWIKHGKLKRVKVRSRVYFLGTDVQNLLK